jgi:hypothetical protein
MKTTRTTIIRQLATILRDLNTYRAQMGLKPL